MSSDEKPRNIISLRNISKYYGDTLALESTDIDIHEGEFFALLGPSGCGKTTIMRIIAGFETPTSGDVLFDGQRINDIAANKRAINMMFQSYALFPHMSVWENIAFGLKRERMPGAQIKNRVAEMLDLVNMSDFGPRKPHQISGGQRQRVALARALAKNPRLILLDEPLSALDQKLRHDTRLELVAIQKRTGTSFIMVTHDQQEALTMATRIGLMSNGKLVQIATPEEIYKQPINRYVADFIGKINLAPCTVVNKVGEDGDNNQYVLNCSKYGSELLTHSNIDLEIGAEAWLAFRPESVEIRHADRISGFDHSENKLQGEVVSVAYLGDTSQVYLKVGPDAVIQANRQNSYSLLERLPRAGDKYHLWLDPKGCFLLRE